MMRRVAKPQIKKKALTLKRALFWIFISTILVSGGASLSVLYYFHIHEIQIKDPRYLIRYLVQEGEGKARVSTQYLAEAMDLSSDSGTNLFVFNLESAQKKLQALPILKTAKIKKQRPNTLLIDYTMRSPLFSLLDYQNTAIDEEGILFPLAPFYEVDGLPKVYLGSVEGEPVWGQKVKKPEIEIALSIADEMKQLEISGNWSLSGIDLSKAFAQSLGEREIVLVLEGKNSGKPLFLRLRNGDLREQLRSFAALAQAFETEGGGASSIKVIDLRLPALAYILK